MAVGWWGSVGHVLPWGPSVCRSGKGLPGHGKAGLAWEHLESTASRAAGPPQLQTQRQAGRCWYLGFGARAPPRSAARLGPLLPGVLTAPCSGFNALWVAVSWSEGISGLS